MCSSDLPPRIRVGEPAEVRANAVPGGRFPGRVVEIAPRAEFTPRAALTEEERADLVFAVRVAVRDTTGALKPGMPVEARIGAVPGPAGAARPRAAPRR